MVANHKMRGSESERLGSEAVVIGVTTLGSCDTLSPVRKHVQNRHPAHPHHLAHCLPLSLIDTNPA